MIKRDGQALVISSIMPNPFSQMVTIDMVAETEGVSTFSIHDKLGQTVKTFALKTVKGLNHIQVNDLSGLSSGVYLLQIRNSDGEVNAKLYKTN